MSEDLKKYLESINFQKQLDDIERKYKNKRILIYGTGLLFSTIVENYDISKLNIIGVSDRKYDNCHEGKSCHGYKIVHFSKIKEQNPDCILISVFHFLPVLYNFKNKFFKNTKIKIIPFADKSFLALLREIWGTSV